MIKDHLPEYWLHPDISQYDVKVIDVKANKLTLEDHYPFFIEGGGQPDDKVTVLLPGHTDPLPVKPVSLTEITVKLPKSFSLKPPFTITLSLDVAFREAVMRAHTCQHLLSALLLKYHGFKTVKAVMTDDQGQLFFDKPFSLDLIPEISSLMNKFIVSHPVDVSSHVLEAGSNQDQTGQVVDLSKIRGVIPQGAPFIRVLSIGADIDLNTCGGTHISSTDRILSFFITTVKKDEIYFICGLKGLDFLSNFNKQLLESSSLNNQPFDKVLPFLSSQYPVLQKQSIESANVTTNLLKTFFESLYQRYTNYISSDNSNFFCSNPVKDIFTWKVWTKPSCMFLLFSSPVDKKIGSEACKFFSDVPITCVSLLLVANNILIISVNHASQIDLNARALADLFKAKFSCKGGGNEFISQLLLDGVSFQDIESFFLSSVLEK